MFSGDLLDWWCLLLRKLIVLYLFVFFCFVYIVVCLCSECLLRGGCVFGVWFGLLLFCVLLCALVFVVLLCCELRLVLVCLRLGWLFSDCLCQLLDIVFFVAGCCVLMVV